MSTASFRLRRPPRCVHLVIEHLDDGRVHEGGDVAQLTVLGDVTQQPAHDLPLLVLGSSGVSRIWRGLAMGPMVMPLLAQGHHQGFALLADGHHVALHGDERHNGLAVVGSEAPTTAASATLGCPTSACSISVVEMRWPEMFMTSSTRPSSHKSPSSSFFAPSPAK